MNDFEEAAWTRRRVLVGGAVAGGVAWAAPAITTIGGSAFAQTGSPAATNISFIALLLNCGGQVFRVKFTNNDDGTFSERSGPDFEVPCAEGDLGQGGANVQPGSPASFEVTLHADGSVTVDTSSTGCVITDFRVKCGTHCDTPQDQSVGTTFPVTFEQCASNQA